MENLGLNIEVKRVHRLKTGKSLKAFADIVVNDAILIKGLRVVEGKNGLFVAMPSEQSAKDNKWYDNVRCLDDDIRDRISQEVLTVYASEEI